MKLIFKKPRTPNFVLTDQGTFPVHKLSRDEFEEYKALIIADLNNKWLNKNEN